MCHYDNETTLTLEKVISEGAELYCERRGSGPLLLLITGGMGDAGFYSSAADILASEFTVLNYDRRCNSRSTGDRSIDMTIAQQARDVVAIVKAMGSLERRRGRKNDLKNSEQ
jgi:pimeloyl-ACP methyl ester carboxylesterase